MFSRGILRSARPAIKDVGLPFFVLGSVRPRFQAEATSLVKAARGGIALESPKPQARLRGLRLRQGQQGAPDAFIAKPFDIDDLLDVIKGQLAAA